VGEGEGSGICASAASASEATKVTISAALVNIFSCRSQLVRDFDPTTM
jgi:hypothetical protein